MNRINSNTMPGVLRAKSKLCLAFIGLFFTAYTAKAVHINYYTALLTQISSISPVKTITSTTTPASSQLYVTVGSGPAISTGRKVITLTKMDFAGNCTFANTYSIPGMTNTDLNAKAIAEDQSPSNLYGFVIAGDYFNVVTGATGHFAMKIDMGGTSILWTSTWADDQYTAAVIVSHDPSNLNHVYVVAQSTMAGTSWPVIYHLNPATGAIIGTQPLKYNPSTTPVFVRDALEVNGSAAASLKGYWCVCDNGNGLAVFAFTPWNSLITNYYTINVAASISNIVMASLTKIDALGSGIEIIGAGRCNCTGVAGTRPYLIELHIGNPTTFSYQYTAVLSPTFPVNENIMPTGIALGQPASKTSPYTALISFNHTGPGVANAGAFSVNLANLTVPAGAMLYVHTPSTLNKFVYSSITPTYSPANMILAGWTTLTTPGGPYTVMSRVNANGSLSPYTCFSKYPINAPIGNATVTTWQTSLPMTKAWTLYAASYFVDDRRGTNTVCGATPSLGGIVPGPFSANYDNTAFVLNNILNADLDPMSEEAVFATTKLIGTDNTMCVNSVNASSQIDLETHYPNAGQDEALATRVAANGDIIIAGRSTLTSSGHKVIFIHRTDNVGNTLWYKYYDQGTVNIGNYVNVVETKVTNDIVVVAAADAGNNNLIEMRTDANGVMEYYDDHAVYANGNSTESYPYVRGICATADDGYATAGCTGENGDFFAALVVKCDGSYTGTHTRDWAYVHRHYLASGYDLSDPDKRSASFANAIMEDASGNLWAAGYTSNCDATGANATYQNGLLIELQSNGTLINTEAYSDGGGALLAYNGINTDGTYILLTGQATDAGTGATRMILAQADMSTYALNWTTKYGTNSINTGDGVFTTATGYMVAGISNDNTGVAAPLVTLTDFSGATGCETTLSVSAATDANDPVSIAYGTSASATENTGAPGIDGTSETITDVCGTPMPEVMRGQTAVKTTALARSLLNVYPNPASDKVNIEVSTLQSTAGQLTLTDVSGRTVYTAAITLNENSSHFEIDMSNLSSGIYILKLTDSKNTVYAPYKVYKL